jgi:hypothetical protein
LLQAHQTLPLKGTTETCLPFCLLDGTSERINQAQTNPQNALEVSFQTSIGERFPVFSLSMYLLDLLHFSIDEQKERSLCEVLVNCGLSIFKSTRLNWKSHQKFTAFRRRWSGSVAKILSLNSWIDAIYQMVDFESGISERIVFYFGLLKVRCGFRVRLELIPDGSVDRFFLEQGHL